MEILTVNEILDEITEICKCEQPEIYLDYATELSDKPEKFCNACDSPMLQSTANKMKRALRETVTDLQDHLQVCHKS